MVPVLEIGFVVFDGDAAFLFFNIFFVFLSLTLRTYLSVLSYGNTIRQTFLFLLS